MKEHLYLIRVFGRNNSLLKFGYSCNIENRILSYKNTNPLLEVLHIWEVPKAKEIEQEFHSINQSSIRNEWYDENMYDTIVQYVNDPLTYIEQIRFESFAEVIKKCKNGDEEYLKWAYNKFDYLKSIITNLGWEKIEKLDYNKTHLIRYNNKYFSDVEKELITHELINNHGLNAGIFVSNVKLKEIITVVYKNLKINKVPKASGIVNYLKVEHKQKMIKGKSSFGYKLL